MLMSFLNRILPFNKTILQLCSQSITVIYVRFNELSLGKYIPQIAKSEDPNAKATVSELELSFLPAMRRLVPQLGSQVSPVEGAVFLSVTVSISGDAGVSVCAVQKATLLSASHWFYASVQAL